MTVKQLPTKKEEIPIFLRKTFHMINNCDPTIATWSDDGLSVIVKDPDLFASAIIPQFFKHNKFSSFVRQLNLYGFRKVKANNLLIADDQKESQSKWWRFKHDNFRRGRPDLLEELKKANLHASVDQQEVENLKQEVSFLRVEMGKLSAVVHQMSSLLHQVTGSADAPANKKRKLSVDHVSSSFLVEDGPLPMLEPSWELNDCNDAIHPEIASDVDLLMEDIPEYQPDSVSPLNKQEQRSISAEFVESMFDFDRHDSTVSNDSCDGPSHGSDAQPELAPSPSVLNRSVSQCDDSFQPNRLDPELSLKLETALSELPKSLQELFVERIVEKIASPEAYQKHVDAVSVLATAAAIEAQNQTMRSDGAKDKSKLSMQNQSEMTLPVAAAALGAFLTKYGSASAFAPGDGNPGTSTEW